jgi:Tfp pilus assembly protein PilE
LRGQRLCAEIVYRARMNRTLLSLAVLCLASCNAVGQYKCRSRQTEAKAMLGSIKAAESSYFAEHKTYSASTSDLGITITPAFYGIELELTKGGKGYKATAKGDKPETMDDEWTVDESGSVTATHDKCHE